MTWGTWEGWGCSLCWWARVFGNRDDLADLLYTTRRVNFDNQSLPGLGLTIVRYNAGACSSCEVDGQSMAVSKNIPPFRRMDGFWLDGASSDPASTSWDWRVDANQRAMLLKARDRGAERFELFSNSPMWWMLTNRNPSGAADGGADNLAPGNYQKDAIYLATVAKYARDHWGLSFTSIEPFNEPLSHWWTTSGKQEGCHFSLTAQAETLKDLCAELDRRGLRTTPISSSDDNSYDEALRNWNAFDPGTKAAVGQVNVHGYQDENGPRALLHQAAVADGKTLWNSEYGDGNKTGLKLARNLQQDLNHLHPTGWCYWQAVDAEGWGLVSGNLADRSLGPVNPKFFVLAQFSRHIRPGMLMLESGDPQTVAAYDPRVHKLVLVLLNDGPARSVPVDLSSLAGALGPLHCWATEPLASARYEERYDAVLKSKGFTALLPAHSVLTFEVNQVVLR